MKILNLSRAVVKNVGCIFLIAGLVAFGMIYIIAPQLAAVLGMEYAGFKTADY